MVATYVIGTAKFMATLCYPAFGILSVNLCFGNSAELLFKVDGMEKNK